MSDDVLRNITTEDALQKQIEQFRALAENSPDIIVRFDRDFRYLYINRSVFNAKIGRIAARIGDSIDDIGLPEHEIELRKEKIRHVFETGQPTNFEFQFPGISGTQWFDARFVPEFAPDGTVASVLVVSRDITKLKQAEIALKESEARFREVLEYSSDAAFRRNLQTNGLDYLSPAFTAISGYTVDEMKTMYAKDILKRIHPDDLPEVERILGESIISPEQFHFLEYRFRHKNGQYRWFQDIVRVINDEQGNPLFRIGNIRDVTNLKQAEAVSRENETRLREIMKYSSDAAYRRNLKTDTYDYMSPAFTRISGYTPEEMMAMPISTVLSRIHPDDLSEIERILAESMSFPGKSYCLEYRFRHKDGRYRWFQDKISVVCDKQKTPLFRIGNVRDITKRKRAEEEMNNSKKILQTMIDLKSEALFMIDPKGTILIANKAFSARFGKEAADVIGANVYDLLPPDVAETRRKYVEDAIQTGKRVYLEDRDGDWDVASFITPEINDQGMITRISILGMNITERKRYENMLIQNGERYRSYVETMNDGFVVFDKDMELAYANDKFSQITGYGKEELIGKTILHHFDEENLKIVKEQFEKRRKGIIAPYQAQAIRKDGTKIFVIISPKPIFDSEGNFQGSFATVADITSRVESETMLFSEHQIMKTQIEASEIQTKELLREIEEYNHALKVLLKNSQNEQKEIEENMVSNVREMVAPFIDKLKSTRLSDIQKNFLDTVESNLNTIVSPFVRKVKAELREFTPMEIQVANLIREGKNNKEISDILTVSENTVLFHRKNIRNKLGLKHKKINLRTHLLTLVR